MDDIWAIGSLVEVTAVHGAKTRDGRRDIVRTVCAAGTLAVVCGRSRLSWGSVVEGKLVVEGRDNFVRLVLLKSGAYGKVVYAKLGELKLIMAAGMWVAEGYSGMTRREAVTAALNGSNDMDRVYCDIKTQYLVLLKNIDVSTTVEIAG